MYNNMSKRLFISAMHNIWQKTAKMFLSNLFPNVSSYQKIAQSLEELRFKQSDIRALIVKYGIPSPSLPDHVLRNYIWNS